MNTKKKTFITALVLTVACGIYTFISHGFNYSYDGKSILWKYMTLWDNGTEGIFFVVVITLCMIGTVLERYKEHYYHFDKNCLIRVGMKKYILSNVKNIIIESIVFMAILHIILLLFDSFYFNDSFFDIDTQYCYFTNNQIMNIIIFITLSCIGMAILNVFFYSLSIYVSNLYLYIVLPIIFLFMTLILGDTLVQIFSQLFDFFLIRILFLSIIPATLVQPGSLVTSAIASYLISIMLYSIIAFINFVYTFKSREISE